MRTLRTETVDISYRPLRGELALVTGAARRIGREIAVGLAAAGADIIAHHRTGGDPVPTLSKEIRGHHVEAWTLQADFADEDMTRGLIDQATHEAGRPPTILVNNASAFPANDWDHASFQHVTDTLRVNAWAPLELMRGFARRANRGAVINLLDARIAEPDPARTPYALSKALLAEMTRMAARQYAPDIRVNAVAPGPVLPPVDDPDADLTPVIRRLPLQRPPTPRDIADAVAFLAQAPTMTGQTLYVDGGQHLGAQTREDRP